MALLMITYTKVPSSMCVSVVPILGHVGTQEERTSCCGCGCCLLSKGQPQGNGR